MHQGTLNFRRNTLRRIRQITKTKPTVICICAERAGIIPEIGEEAAPLWATFGYSDSAVPDVLSGNSRLIEELPIELPSLMETVRNQEKDLPYDSESPLFRSGLELFTADQGQN
jgi:beta-glucosidase